MRCERCGEERPLEDFEVGVMRPPLHSHELQALDRLRRDPEQVCKYCFQPGHGITFLDQVLADGDTADTDWRLDVLADVVDWFRRLGRGRD